MAGFSLAKRTWNLPAEVMSLTERNLSAKKDVSCWDQIMSACGRRMSLGLAFAEHQAWF